MNPHDKQRIIKNTAAEHGLSADAVANLWDALVRGNATMAQFNHPELGGMGQWMAGGMTMVGDMFNNSLKQTVDTLCSELVPYVQAYLATPGLRGTAATPGDGGNWWPAQLGQPAASGGQNQLRYAYFPHHRRLLVEVNGRQTLYDTLDHHIQGFSQQQPDTLNLRFSSQHGTFTVDALKVVT
ncbi:MAG: hypothetical protein ACFCBW_09340 [Candidatus Competibacterales bacterium]